MFDNNQLSVTPSSSPYLRAGQAALSSRVWDAEDGPIAEQDPSKGHFYQQWRAYIKDLAVWVEADNTPPKAILSSPNNTITDISIAFNQNADLHYTWVDNGAGYLYWFNTLTTQFEIMSLGAIVTPKLTLDDKRPSQSGRSDIVLTYLKNNELYFRLQRERFDTEHHLHSGPFLSIERCYMSTGLRLQWTVTRLVS